MWGVWGSRVKVRTLGGHGRVAAMQTAASQCEGNAARAHPTTACARGKNLLGAVISSEQHCVRSVTGRYCHVRSSCVAVCRIY